MKLPRDAKHARHKDGGCSKKEIPKADLIKPRSAGYIRDEAKYKGNKPHGDLKVHKDRMGWYSSWGGCGR
jgi:hypothetical protein